MFPRSRSQILYSQSVSNSNCFLSFDWKIQKMICLFVIWDVCVYICIWQAYISIPGRKSFSNWVVLLRHSLHKRNSRHSASMDLFETNYANTRSYCLHDVYEWSNKYEVNNMKYSFNNAVILCENRKTNFFWKIITKLHEQKISSWVEPNFVERRRIYNILWQYVHIVFTWLGIIQI